MKNTTLSRFLQAALSLAAVSGFLAFQGRGLAQQAGALPADPAASAPDSSPAANPAAISLPPPSSPSGPDVETLPIDLPTALSLANANNPTVAIARARVQEAYARLREAQVLWLPNLETGPAYLRHDGLVQNARGEVFDTSKWNLFTGGGAMLSVETSNAIFAPRIARRLVDAQAAAAQSVAYDIQLRVALAYLELLRTHGALAVNKESLANAKEILRLAQAAERNEFGKTPADANRAQTEVDQRLQEQIELEGQVGVASARLAQLLLLQPTVDLWPVDPAVVPIMLFPEDSNLDDLVAAGLMNRPELAESRALVAAALARWREAKLGPLFPRLDVGYLAGNFQGGINDTTERSGSRGDALAQAVWTLRNFGAGDLARNRIGRAQYDQANLHVAEIQAQIGAEVSAAAKLARSRRRTLESAQQGVRQGEEMWRRLMKWTIEVGFGRAKLYEAVELILAEQALNQARFRYLDEVIEYNKAQFRLFWAMGQPPLCALGNETALPVQVPVLPKESKPMMLKEPKPEELPAPRPAPEKK
jgi:outer membrane protein TolC